MSTNPRTEPVKDIPGDYRNTDATDARWSDRYHATSVYSAGARFTVTRRLGNAKPEEAMAALTRSLASRTAVSGRPTSMNLGSWLPT
jgi:hypothetical protein